MSDFDRTHEHRSPLAGERAADLKAGAHAQAMWRRIMAQLEEAGELGMTPDEFADEHRLLINTVRRRFTDLWKDGQIRHHPAKLHRPNAAGNPCVVWVVGRDDSAPAPTDRGWAEHEVKRLRAALEAVKRNAGKGAAKVYQIASDALQGREA